MAPIAVISQRVCEWDQPTAPHEGHHDVDPVGRFDLGQDLPAHSRLSGSVGQQRRVQQRDQWSLRHTNRSIRSPITDPVKRLTRRQGRSLHGIALRDVRADLTQQPSSHVDPDGHALRVRNGIQRSAQQSREILRDPIGGIRRPQGSSVDEPPINSAKPFVHGDIEDRLV